MWTLADLVVADSDLFSRLIRICFQADSDPFTGWRTVADSVLFGPWLIRTLANLVVADSDLFSRRIQTYFQADSDPFPGWFGPWLIRTVADSALFGPLLIRTLADLVMADSELLPRLIRTRFQADSDLGWFGPWLIRTLADSDLLHRLIRTYRYFNALHLCVTMKVICQTCYVPQVTRLGWMPVLNLPLKRQKHKNKMAANLTSLV